MEDGQLYRRTFLGPLLKCVTHKQAATLINEVGGLCEIQALLRMVVAKLMNAGYYCPDMFITATEAIRKYQNYQKHVLNTLRPKNNLIQVMSA